MTKTALLLDRDRGVIHRRDCPGLLAVCSPTFEPFVGLELGLEAELTLCMCLQAFTMRFVSRLLAQHASSARPGVARVSRDLEKLAQAFDEALAKSWAGAASAPSSGARSDH